MFKKKTLNNDIDVLFYCKCERKKSMHYNKLLYIYNNILKLFKYDHHNLILLGNKYIKFASYYITKILYTTVI